MEEREKKLRNVRWGEEMVVGNARKKRGKVGIDGGILRERKENEEKL